MNFSKHIANQLNKTSSFNNIDELLEYVQGKTKQTFDNYLFDKWLIEEGKYRLDFSNDERPITGYVAIDFNIINDSTLKVIITGLPSLKFDISNSHDIIDRSLAGRFDLYKSKYKPTLPYKITPKDVVIPEPLPHNNKGGEGIRIIFEIADYVLTTDKLRNIAKKITSKYYIDCSKNDSQEEQAATNKLQDQYVDEIVARFNEKLKTL